MPDPIRMALNALKGYGLESKYTGLLRQPTSKIGQLGKALNPITARNILEDAILDQAEKILPHLKTNVGTERFPLSQGTLYNVNPKLGLFVDTLVPDNTAAGTLAEEDPETYRKIKAMEAAKAGIERAKERAFGVGPSED